MTGKELISFIESHQLQNGEIFIGTENSLLSPKNISGTRYGDIFLSEKEAVIEDYFGNENNLLKYFSEWFDLISKEEAKRVWGAGNRSFLVLAPDGTDRYAFNFASWEEIEQSYPDAYFGWDKMKA